MGGLTWRPALVRAAGACGGARWRIARARPRPIPWADGADSSCMGAGSAAEPRSSGKPKNSEVALTQESAFWGQAEGGVVGDSRESSGPPEWVGECSPDPAC